MKNKKIRIILKLIQVTVVGRLKNLTKNKIT